MYESKNFQFHQYALGRFKELCNEHKLYLLMSPIIEGEVRSHLVNKGHEAAKHIKDFKKIIRILRNLPDLKHHGIFEELHKTTVEKMLLDKFQDYIDEAVYENLNLDSAKISSVITKYFNKQPPFSDGKKNEFPDSFILESLLAWSKDKKIQVYVLSTDGDMESFCNESDGWLIYSNDLDKFINLVLTNEAELSDISKFAEKQFNTLLKKIEESLEERINDIEYTTIGYGIDDEVDDVNAYDLHILEKNIIKADREYAEFSLAIKYTVEAWHRLTDHDRSIWDPEDKKYLFTAQTSRKVLHEVHCNAYVWIEFEDGLAVNTFLSEANIEDSYIELDPDDGAELDHIEHDIFEE